MTQPFDDIRALFAQFPAPHTGAAEALDIQAAALGDLAGLARWIALWRGGPSLNRPILALYAGAHAGGDASAARTQLEAIASGAAPVSRAVRHLGAGLDVFDLALQRPVADTAVKAAMSERECAATMAFGMEALAKQPDLLILGGFGPGAEAAAADLAEALAGRSGSPAVQRAQAEAGGDALQLLRQLGGRETAAVAGAILAARIQSVPVLLSGAPALAAAMVLAAMDGEAVAHCRLGAVPAGFDASPLVERLGPAPVALGPSGDDATAAIAVLALVKLAVAVAAPGPG